MWQGQAGQTEEGGGQVERRLQHLPLWGNRLGLMYQEGMFYAVFLEAREGRQQPKKQLIFLTPCLVLEDVQICVNCLKGQTPSS